MLFVPSAAEFTWIDSKGDGWQPTAPTQVTAAQNAYGSYVSLIAGSLVTSDVVGFWLIVSNGSTAAAARDTLVTVGLDQTGGTSFSDFVTDIAVPSSSNYANPDTGIWYWFPVRIPAGASVGVKASVNNAVPGSCRARVVLACKPKPPEACKVGSYVVTYGSVPSSSRGTSITAGTASEGAWTLVGTVAAGDRPWFWQVGLGINTTSMGDGLAHIDLGIGDASNKRVVIQNQFVMTTSNELVSAIYIGGGAVAIPSDGIYVRVQATNSFSGSLSAIAHGVC